MSACNCCEQFPMVFDLEHRGSSFSLSKCGFTNLDFYWLDNEDLELCYDGDGVFFTITKTWEPDPGDPFDRTTYTVTETYTYDPVTKSCTYERTPAYDEAPYDDIFGSGTFSYALSGEYTTEELMQNVADAIPTMEGEWVPVGPYAPAESRREFIEKEGCVSIGLYTESTVEVRIAHPPTATGYLKVWLVARAQSYDPLTDTYGPPTDEPLEEYEWQGEPADMTAGINEESNRVEGATIAVPRPDEQTKVTVEVWKFSFLPEYEPADPAPTAENNYALTRPVPDCLSNGVPTLNAECPPTP